MFPRRWFWLSLGILPLFFLVAADQVAFKTIKARDAKATYDDAMKKAETEYNEKVMRATKIYLSRLEAAKGAVVQSGDLDEANNLQAEMKRLEQEIKDFNDTRAVLERGLLIERAQSGFGDKWADVTALVRSRQKNDAVNNVPNLPDPAWGKQKTMIVEGIYGGKQFILSFNARDPGGRLVFGKRSKELSIVRE